MKRAQARGEMPVRIHVAADFGPAAFCNRRHHRRTPRLGMARLSVPPPLSVPTTRHLPAAIDTNA